MLRRRLIVFSIFLVVLSAAAYILLVIIPERVAENTYGAARAISQDLKEAFRFSPEVHVNNTVILQEQHDIMELSMVSQKFRHEYDWTNTWMGSTKKIAITGTFEAKAGFDLDKKIAVDIRGEKAFIFLPHAQLLSLTPQHDVAFRDESGVWNWVNEQDRSDAMNAFTKDAQNIASTAQFINRAEAAFEQKAGEIFRTHGMEPVFIYGTTMQKE
jgi:hypothetical protein